MGKVSGFEDLEIWNLAREICKDVWHLFETSPLGKDYGLMNQMNSSSGSVMDNIAEGYERNGNKEFIQFLSIAKASNGELRSQIYRCLDRNHISKTEHDALLERTIILGKKIGAFIAYLKKSERKGSKYE